MKLDREMFIPKQPGVVTVRDKLSSAIIYLYDDNAGRPCVRGFSGKRAKPDIRYYFRSIASREKTVTEWLARVREIEGRKAEQRAAEKAFRHSYKVGDIFRASWGYEQTNIDYYEVVRLIGDTMMGVREIGQEREATGWERGRCVPVPGKFIGDEVRVKAQDGHIKVGRQYAWFEKPEIVAGVPVYESANWTAYA